VRVRTVDDFVECMLQVLNYALLSLHTRFTQKKLLIDLFSSGTLLAKKRLEHFTDHEEKDNGSGPE
jgi:hypothetical protein